MTAQHLMAAMHLNVRFQSQMNTKTMFSLIYTKRIDLLLTPSHLAGDLGLGATVRGIIRARASSEAVDESLDVVATLLLRLALHCAYFRNWFF
jgi:hypothetical protein